MADKRAQVRIESATMADLTEVTDVFYACWHVTYPAVLPPELIEKFDYEGAQALWKRVLENSGPGELLVARGLDDEALGVVRWAIDNGEGAVHSLYVSPSAQGLGVGSRMLNAACEQIAARGAGVVRLWVFRDNHPSREFYARQGFEPDGEARTQEQFGQPEIRLMRRLSGEAL